MHLMDTYLSWLAIFVLLLVICAALHYVVEKHKPKETLGHNPIFVQFQRKYFVAYFLALSADWLQGPYLYKLYRHYGFVEPQIAVLYVCGFASSVVFGTATSAMADHYGRRKLCITFSVIYSISCLTKLSYNYGVLILGRVLGGVSTSLLFTAYEAWYMHEHIETHDFPKEWAAVTFAKASQWNAVLAIAAGVVSNLVAGLQNERPVAPFMLAVPLLLTSGAVVAWTWRENAGRKTERIGRTCTEGLRHIVNSRRMLLIGAMQSLFESVMYIFVFLWTPVLDVQPYPPLGFIFSSFMVCILIGSYLFKLLSSWNVAAYTIVNGSIVLALAAIFVCVGSAGSYHDYRAFSYAAFLALEVACGLYFPSMGFLRGRILPEAHRSGIINWFRVPLNLIVCILLMVLHGDSSSTGTWHIFIICSVLLAVALFCGLHFAKMVKGDKTLRPGAAVGVENGSGDGAMVEAADTDKTTVQNVL